MQDTTPPPGSRIHAFRDDILADHDAVALAEMVRRGDVSDRELADAAIERIQLVEPHLHAIAYPMFDQPRYADTPDGALYGVPTLVKDNTDLRGVPSNHGSEAFAAHRSHRDGAYTRQYLSTGMTVLAKSRMPEFGFNATTEFMTQPPTANPWRTDRSVGASSGGSAALVAAGAVPIAHANDGGGSIRIPAACAGLVGLKPSRGRHIDGEQARHLPLNMVSEGVVTRSVRDTAAFFAASEDHYRNPRLPPVGLVVGPAQRRLRVGVAVETVTGAVVDEQTKAAVQTTAALLEKAGHHVEPIELPVTEQFADDFLQYWALLAELAADTGRLVFDRSFNGTKLDGLTRGLRHYHRRHMAHTPAALRRLRAAPRAYARLFQRHEIVLTPVLGHVPPPLGYLAPTVDYDELIQRLRHYVAFTPLNNIAGTPAISLPAAVAHEGVPIAIQLAAAYGDERTLLEVAFLLEAERPFPKITD